MESVVQFSAYRRPRPAPVITARPPQSEAQIVILPVVRIVRADPVSAGTAQG